MRKPLKLPKRSRFLIPNKRRKQKVVDRCRDSARLLFQLSQRKSTLCSKPLQGMFLEALPKTDIRRKKSTSCRHAYPETPRCQKGIAWSRQLHNE